MTRSGRTRRAVALAAMLFVPLAASCVAPPPGPSDYGFGVLSESNERSLFQEVTVDEAGAAVTARLTSLVAGEVRVCAVLDAVSPYGTPPPTTDCVNVVVLPGSVVTPTFSLVSPTGEYPYDGVISFTTSVFSPTFVGDLVSADGATLGCLGYRFDLVFACTP